MRDAASPLGQALAAWLRWSNSRAEPGSKLAAISRTSAATRRHAELVGEAVDKSDINDVVESIWHHMGSAVRPIDFDVAQQPHDRPHRTVQATSRIDANSEQNAPPSRSGDRIHVRTRRRCRDACFRDRSCLHHRRHAVAKTLEWRLAQLATGGSLWRQNML
ncbi:MAG: hypothetical protein B7Y90_18470 [Alphaproteobacteria bacterium 32-64-14]|nr:MAG: hypothetical protein B7Y90_18470 [Alphaproteobacteria bacterium 32-64-14]